MGLKQLLQKATRICDTTKTLINIIASNKPEFIRRTEIFLSQFNDHEIVDCVHKLNHQRFKPIEMKCP